MESGTFPKAKEGVFKKTELAPEEKEWMTDEFWPTPKWLVESENITDKKSYQEYLKYNLRTRYYELEGDFRTAYYNFAPSLKTDFGTARRIVGFLKGAKLGLESGKVNLLDIATLLDLAERFMIWLFPGYSARERAFVKAKHLELTNPEYATIILNAINKFDDNPDEDSLASVKSAYDEVVGEINKHNKQSQISFGLQIERLELLRKWGIIGLLIAVLALPLLVDLKWLEESGTFDANVIFQAISDVSPFLFNFCLLIVLAIMGGLGGFISGLLQVRNTKVGLVEFKESLLKFQLKPIIGGLTAVLISVLLSWQILPGIEIQDLGAFIMIAFLAGFSERYFLKLLKIDKETNLVSGQNTFVVDKGKELLNVKTEQD